MRHVIENVKRLRRELNLSQVQLSERLTDVGRPIRATGLHRLETGKRRVDADDLVGLAAAFGVSPISLLLPPTTDGEVAITETISVDAQRAWEWLRAQRPLLDQDEDALAEWIAFQRRSLPLALRRAPLNRGDVTVRRVEEIAARLGGGDVDGEHHEAT
jgi:transcriptional regulator with XRE-family HTH domain